MADKVRCQGCGKLLESFYEERHRIERRIWKFVDGEYKVTQSKQLGHVFTEYHCPHCRSELPIAAIVGSAPDLILDSSGRRRDNIGP